MSRNDSSGSSNAKRPQERYVAADEGAAKRISLPFRNNQRIYANTIFARERPLRIIRAAQVNRIIAPISVRLGSRPSTGNRSVLRQGNRKYAVLMEIALHAEHVPIFFFLQIPRVGE
jgi:hypothetical protein